MMGGMDKPSMIFLAASISIFMFNSFSNMLEYGGITDSLHAYGNYIEILFDPLFIFFVYSYLSWQERSKTEKVRDDILLAITDVRSYSKPMADRVRVLENKFSSIESAGSIELPDLNPQGQRKCRRPVSQVDIYRPVKTQIYYLVSANFLTLTFFPVCAFNK